MTDPKVAVAEVTTPTTFNFAAAVLDRSYPTSDVLVYLDEKSIQTLIDIHKERSELEQRIANTIKPGVKMANALEALNKKYQDTVTALRDGEYVVTVRGIAPERTAALEAQSYEDYPREYVTTVNPVTGQNTKTEIEDEKRDLHFATLLRQAHLVRVTSPTGAVDEDFADLDKVRAIFSRLPLLARAKVDEAINATTIMVDFYRDLVDEVF